MGTLKYDVIVSTANAGHLANLVQRALNSGWRLQGGVSVSSGTGYATPLFCQAVVHGEES